MSIKAFKERSYQNYRSRVIREAMDLLSPAHSEKDILRYLTSDEAEETMRDEYKNGRDVGGAAYCLYMMYE